MRTRWILLAVLVGRTAAADPVVLAVDGNDIYVELGARDGVGAGSELELIHEIVAKDPRSGATLRDHFALGTLTVAKSGDKLSVAHAPAELARRVMRGDRVQLSSARHRYIDPWQDRIAPARPAAVSASASAATGPLDHVELARIAWQDTLGGSPEQRIERWQRLVAADPGSPYRKAIDAEIASLREQAAARDRALAAARSTRATDRGPRIATLAGALAVPSDDRSAPIALGPVGHAVPDHPLELAFVIRDPAAFQRAWLYVRASGEPGFTRLELVSDGDAYLRATAPAALVKAPSLDWYVEAGIDDRTAPVLGSQGAPRTIAVDRVVAEAPIARGRSHIDLHLDYVDFDSAERNNGHHDRYYLAEVAFSYRFLDPIYAVNLGFGTLSGTSGPKQVIDGDPMGQCRDNAGAGDYRCKEVTFSYVYTELEFRLHSAVALLIRPQVGLLTTDSRLDTSPSRCRGADIEDCKFDVGLGLRGRVRFGEELGTNLVVGAGFTRGVGTLLEASYQWLPATIVPVQLGVQVTDQPVIEDFGVRLIADIGLRRLPWFYPSLRASYQARSTNHAGFSGGLAINFNW